MRKMNNPFMGICIISFVILIAVPGNGFAVQVQWAGKVLYTNIDNAEDALGKPDGVQANFQDGNPTTIETATYFGFGTGDNVGYNSLEFSLMLGISEVLLEQADFISFECNGRCGDWYEGSEWIFNDGNYSLTVSYAHGDSSPKAIIALGKVSIEAYADFFDIQNLCIGEYVYILFDIDGDSVLNPLTPDFNVTINAEGASYNSPDPDVMGLIVNLVPGPCAGDFDKDGDVDGSDLAVFAADFGRTDCPLVNQQESLKNENQLLREEIERLKAENLILKAATLNGEWP